MQDYICTPLGYGKIDFKLLSNHLLVGSEKAKVEQRLLSNWLSIMDVSYCRDQEVKTVVSIKN